MDVIFRYCLGEIRRYEWIWVRQEESSFGVSKHLGMLMNGWGGHTLT